MRRVVLTSVAAALMTLPASALASDHFRPVAGPKAKPPPRLSRAAVRAVKPGCNRYTAAVRPYLYGAGVDDLRNQVGAFRHARARLSRDLRRAITRRRDTRIARPLVGSLRDTHLLSRALAQLDDGRIEAAFATLARWGRQTAREHRIARRIGIPRCMDPSRRG